MLHWNLSSVCKDWVVLYFAMYYMLGMIRYYTVQVEERLQRLDNLVFCNLSYVVNNRVVHCTSRRALATEGNTGR